MSSVRIVFLLALWFLISDLATCEETGYVNGGGYTSNGTYGGGYASNACNNCTICQYPCHPQPPPMPPPPAGYLSYGAAPPPPAGAVSNCTPGVPSQCCQYLPPMPNTYYPYSKDSASSRIKDSISIGICAILLVILFV